MGGGNLEKTCSICLKTMGGDHFKRHMKRHEKKPYSIDEAQTYMCDTCGEIKQMLMKLKLI